MSPAALRSTGLRRPDAHFRNQDLVSAGAVFAFSDVPPTTLKPNHRETAMTDTTETQSDRHADESDAHNKTVIFETLAEAGIHNVIVSFDGYSDSGQIEAIDAVDEANHSIALPDNRPVRLMSSAPDDLPAETTLREAIEMLAYRYLEATHMGWEDKEGAFGTFVFTVPDRTITLEHNERFTDVAIHNHSF
jgi:hypothetical protein